MVGWGGMVSYREKTAVPSMNKVEGRAEEPCAGRNVVNFEVGVHWGSPRGDRSCIGTLSMGR